MAFQPHVLPGERGPGERGEQVQGVPPLWTGLM